MISRISLLLAGVLLCSCTLLPDSLKKKKSEPLPSVTGTWELILLKGEDPEGRFYYPFDKEAQGIAFFDENNKFGIQYNDPDRPRMSRQDPYYCADPEIRIAYLSTRSYYGRYQMTQDTIVFDIKNSNLSNNSGRRAKYAFKIHGDTLHLISPKMRLNGQNMIEHSFWFQECFEAVPQNKIKAIWVRFNGWVKERLDSLKT